MKNLILIIIVIIVSSCTDKKEDPNKYPQYSLTTVDYVQDSLRDKFVNDVERLVRATNQHLSAGDYEDVWVTLRVVKSDILLPMYGTRIRALKIMYKNQEHTRIIKPKNLTENQRTIFNDLFHKEQRNERILAKGIRDEF